MCFSAGASFTASAVLLTIGAVAIKKSGTPAQRLLTCIPVFFSIQQFSEGLLWLGLAHPGYRFLNRPATYVFLLFAQVVWPVILPLCTLYLEKSPAKRKVLKLLLGSGILVALYLAFCLLAYRVNPVIDYCHINYQQQFPKLPFRYSGLFYLIPTIISPHISGNRRWKLLGVVLVLSYVITQILYLRYFISVWCFFASAISLIVLAIIISLNNHNSKDPLMVQSA